MSRRAALALRAAVAGSVSAILWLPIGLAPLLPLGVLLAIRGLNRAGTAREAALFGAVFGAVRYAVAAHFLLALLEHSPLAVLLYLFAIAFIVPWAVLEAWGAYRIEARWGLPRPVGFGILFALGEWVRSIGDLSLPADQVAHAYGVAPGWLWTGKFVGPFGLTLLVFAVAALAERAIEHRATPRRAAGWGAAAIGLWLSIPAADLLDRAGSKTDPPTLRVGIVQPAVEIAEKLDRERWPALWDRLERLTRDAARGADLVVWPESARPGPLVWKEDEGPLRDERVESLAAAVGVPILYGCELARVRGGKVRALHNAAVLARPEGGRVEWYGKQRLLPFVEGVPFAAVLGWDPFERPRTDDSKKSPLTLFGNFAPGRERTLFSVGEARIGVLICYEGLYPGLGRAYRRAGANALVVLTNDAWWGRSVFPRWHARMIAARARELDLPVLRAANSGESCLVDRTGRTRVSSRLGEVTHLSVETAVAATTPTFYSRFGDLTMASLLVLLVGSFSRASMRRRSRRPSARRRVHEPASG